MKKIVALVAISMGLSTAALAAQETCYQVSADGIAWSRTPESICLTETGDREYSISLKSGLSFAQQEIAKFNMTLLQQARCLDCNANVYGVANPSNSTFNALAIRFNGKIDVRTREEAGTVSIGQNKFYYRSYIYSR